MEMNRKDRMAGLVQRLEPRSGYASDLYVELGRRFDRLLTLGRVEQAEAVMVPLVRIEKLVSAGKGDHYVYVTSGGGLL